MTEQVLKEELSYLIANIIAYEDIAFAEAYAERFFGAVQTI